jgi:C4-type Zn-finger protein
MDYNYLITTEYDGETYFTHRINDFVDASDVWQKITDHGNAKQFATYTLTDPTGKSFVKHFTVKNG